jgi:hypothetical protein
MWSFLNSSNILLRNPLTVSLWVWYPLITGNSRLWRLVNESAQNHFGGNLWFVILTSAQPPYLVTYHSTESWNKDIKSDWSKFENVPVNWFDGVGEIVSEPYITRAVREIGETVKLSEQIIQFRNSFLSEGLGISIRLWHMDRFYNNRGMSSLLGIDSVNILADTNTDNNSAYIVITR